jgi:hypothetical protein
MLTYDWAQLDAFATMFSELRIEIYSVAFLIFLAGYFGRIWQKRREPTQHIETIGYIGMLVILAVSMEPLIKPLATTIFVWPAEKLEASNENFQLHKTLTYFSKSINSPASSKGESFLTKIGATVVNFTTFGLKGILSLIGYALYKVTILLSTIITVPMLILGRLLPIVLFAFSPIAVACLAVPALKEKGASYLAVMFSILTWPLGFAIVAGMANVAIAMLPTGGDLPASETFDGVASQMIVGIAAPICGALILIGGSVLVPSTSAYIFLYGGTVFNPVSAAGSAIPYVGKLFARR